MNLFIRLIIAFAYLTFGLNAIAQHEHVDLENHHPEHVHYDIYDLDLEQELAIIGTGISLNLLGRFMINKADPASLEEINALDPNDLFFFDRAAINNYSATAETISDVILYTSATLPFLTYVTKHCREEVANIGIMGIETFLLTYGLTNITKGTFKRYRPFNYNPDVPIEMKLSTNSRVSFFSGHASTTAAMSFFAARIITDTHPDLKNKWLIWATAATLPATVSYLRHLAGKHFVSDITTGYIVGAGIGLLIPKIHMTKNLNVAINPTGMINLRAKF